MAIPPFDENSNLPPGIHWAEWSEFEERFGTTDNRSRRIQGLYAVMKQLKAAGCRTIYINGSFVTNKFNPGDFDACWDREEVDMDYLKINAPTLLKINEPAAQKAKYRGEVYPSDQPIDNITSYDFFQRDRFGNSKGLVAIDLVRWSP
ncbi:MAG: hypothetical protein GDA43_17330 [Hormoscilla sp. SP5CHS1]|nr:hypothetical protein [Hormoscilla sp. SP5CHS1]